MYLYRVYNQNNNKKPINIIDIQSNKNVITTLLEFNVIISLLNKINKIVKYKIKPPIKTESHAPKK
jgi:hypothetical protein